MSFRDERHDSDTLTQHVGLKGHDSMDIFLEDEDRAKFVKSITQACEKYDVDLLVYVLMDNHVHLILRGLIEDFQYVFESVGATYARWFNRKYGNKGAFWEQRYYNLPIDDEEQFLRTAAYIFNNPVYAGMVSRPQDYEWSNFCQLRDRECEPEVLKAVDELANLSYLIPYTIAEAKRKIAREKAKELELIRRKRVCDRDLVNVLLDFGGEKTTGISLLAKEKWREVVAKMWEKGANSFQISRVARISSYFVRKTVATL